MLQVQTCCLGVQGAMPGCCGGSGDGSRGGLRWWHSDGCEGASSPGEVDRRGRGGHGRSAGGREALASASKPSKQKNVALRRATGCHELEGGGSQHGHGTLLSPASLASPLLPLCSHHMFPPLDLSADISLPWRFGTQISYLFPLLNAQFLTPGQGTG